MISFVFTWLIMGTFLLFSYTSSSTVIFGALVFVYHSVLFLSFYFRCSLFFVGGRYANNESGAGIRHYNE